MDNKEREYLISNPSKITKDSRIIIGLHGYTDSARRFAYYSGLHNVVKSSDIVIYPQAVTPKDGQKNGWNGGFCCGSGWKQNIDDVKFLQALIEEVSSSHNLKNHTAYITGFSNGAIMSMKFAAEKPTYTTAVAGVSGTIGTDKSSIKPTEPIPILLIHGKQDKTIPINGGDGSDPDFKWLSFKNTTRVWEQVNDSSVQTKQIINEDAGHQWKDWRIFKPWHTKNKTSLQVIEFFNSI